MDSTTSRRAPAGPGSEQPAQDGFDSVSFPEEQLLLVDEQDRVLGYGSKQRLHAGEGLLHRAFSVFLFDAQNRLLLHRRSDLKPLWPGFWTNSCCSHPRRGERLESAVTRRLREELGVAATALQEIYSFEYRARYADVGSEYEMCHVFLARLGGGEQPRVHPAEISSCCWLRPDEVDAWMTARRAELTPWFQLEWQALRAGHRAQLQGYLDGALGPRSAA